MEQMVMQPHDRHRWETTPVKDDAVRRVRRNSRKYSAGLPWTASDEELLSSLFPITGTEELATRLGRSRWAVLGKARSLGLERDLRDGRRRPRHRGCRWSSDEIELLTTLYQILPYEEVAERMGRSHDAVTMKARKLGLRKMEEWSPAEDELLREAYRDQSHRQTAERLERTVPAVKTRAVVLGLEPKVPEWTKDEIRLLKDCYRAVELDAIAAELGRTRAATAKKAREMGLVRHRRWSQEEMRTLRELYPRCSARDLANKLGRSYTTVRHKASQMGLRRRSQPAEVRGIEAKDTRKAADAIGAIPPSCCVGSE